MIFPLVNLRLKHANFYIWKPIQKLKTSRTAEKRAPRSENRARDEVHEAVEVACCALVRDTMSPHPVGENLPPAGSESDRAAVAPNPQRSLLGFARWRRTLGMMMAVGMLVLLPVLGVAAFSGRHGCAPGSGLWASYFGGRHAAAGNTGKCLVSIKIAARFVAACETATISHRICFGRCLDSVMIVTYCSPWQNTSSSSSSSCLSSNGSSSSSSGGSNSSSNRSL